MTATVSSIPSIADLWREARTWLADALHAFRGPAGIARTLAREARAAIRRRLALIESLVMKLLLIEAAQSSPARGGGPELPRKREEGEGDVCSEARTRPSVSRCALDSSPQSGEHKARVRIHRSEDPADPSTWRVRFRLRIPSQHATGATARLALTPRPEHVRAQSSARRLARRFEALRRVIADPRSAIANLARTLARFGAAARAIARAIAWACGPRGGNPGRAFAAAIVLANDASFAFPGDTG